MRIRHATAITVVFVLGVYSHITWAYVQDIKAQVEACQKINCTEVAGIAEDLEKYQLPVTKSQQKKGVN